MGGKLIFVQRLLYLVGLKLNCLSRFIAQTYRDEKKYTDPTNGVCCYKRHRTKNR